MNNSLMYRDGLEAVVCLVDELVFGYPHSIAVAKMASAFMESRGASEADVEKLYIASLLHDVGHIFSIGKRRSLDALPDQEPGIRDHPRTGAEFLRSWPSLQPLLQMVENHQERVDGSGYPGRKRADELTEFDQILSISDVYVALTHRNIIRGRDGMPVERAVSIVRAEAGRRWSFDLVAEFIAFAQSKPEEIQ
jgi:putative nucleotidyltransferase with HDIG domain